MKLLTKTISLCICGILLFTMTACNKQVTQEEIVIPEQVQETFTETKETQEDSQNEIQEEPGVKTVFLSEPTFSYSCSDQVTFTDTAPLSLTLSKQESADTDDDTWFANHGLSRNEYSVPNPFVDNSGRGTFPTDIEDTINGLIVTQAFMNGDYLFCTYGEDFSEGTLLNIFNSETHELLYSFDFSFFQYYGSDIINEDIEYIKEAVEWAQIQDDILYVTTFHNTYAKSSGNKNGYITAIDLKDNSILWRSDALVNNASTFEIIGDVIVCGYGFTDEDDFLYQLDKYNGKTLDKIPVKSGPEMIVEKDGVIYVRTYNTDYEFTY